MRIYTITLNPAYDVHAYAEQFVPFHENLAVIQSREAGGKGLNISRALDTAKLVMEGRSEPMHIVPDLREQHMGLFEPKTVEEIRAEDPDFYRALMGNWEHLTPPEGEPFDTGLAPRVAKVLDELVEKGEDCLIVAHNGPLVFAISYLLGMPIEAAGKFYLKQGCFSMIEIDRENIYNPSHALLRYYNV